MKMLTIEIECSSIFKLLFESLCLKRIYFSLISSDLLYLSMNNLFAICLLSALLTLPASTLFCSPYCLGVLCTGTGKGNCILCPTGWVQSGSNCSPPSTFTIVDQTSDIVYTGTLAFNPSARTSSNGYSYVSVSSSSSITITASTGTSQPHFNLELDCWLVAEDGANLGVSNEFQVALIGGSTQTRAANNKIISTD